MSKSKQIVEMDDDLPVRFPTEEEERRFKVWDMKVRGLTLDAIAATLGISVSTVSKDIKELGRRYRDELQQVDPVTILAENLQWLDEMERVCMFEASTAGKVKKKIRDPNNEQDIEFEINDPNKSRFLQTALKCRSEKVKLLLDTGIIPKDPDKLREGMGALKKVEEKIESRRKRTPEEIEESIEHLLNYGRKL